MRQEKIFTSQFMLLCMSSFLFFISFNIILPELPDYLTSMGGEAYKGLIIGVFTLTAGFSRPFSGNLTDKWGRIPVMIVGAGVCAICGLFYPFIHSVGFFLVLRFFHGFSTGFKPTGTAAYIADVVPNARRGEAMGIYGFVTSTGMAFGPYLGSLIAKYYSINTLFYLSSCFALLSVAILYSMKETLPLEKRQVFSFSLFKIKRKDVFHRDIWPVAVVVFLTSFGFGTVITLSPDLSKIVGLENKGLYFLIFTLSSLFTRIAGGKISDKKGRVNVLIFGSFFMVLALALTSITSHYLFFVFGGICFGMAWGLISPSYQAWTIDLCSDETRGRAVATMYIALEAGIGLGAVLPMFLYNNDPNRIGYAFQACSVVASLSVIFLIWYKMTYKVK
ncbi:MAG: MFS family permease [Arcticibacterium sp.]|jgi:MFS family permease